MGDTLSLNEASVAVLVEARSSAAPEEACGLLLVGGTGTVEVARTPNRSRSPRTSFVIDPDALLRAAVSGRLVGCWHTHPAGPAVPSVSDTQTMEIWPDLVHLIVGESLRAWRWSPQGPIAVRITSDGTPGLLWSARP